MVRILRVKPLGSGYGGSGTIQAAPGIQHGPRNDTLGDKDSPDTLAAYAAEREQARRNIQGTTIASKGNL